VRILVPQPFFSPPRRLDAVATFPAGLRGRRPECSALRGLEGRYLRAPGRRRHRRSLPVPHPLAIPQYVLDRIEAKRGRLHVFDRFEPRATAMVVLDMQNFFVAEVETARSIVPNINRLAGAVRARGGLVAWVQLTVAETADGPSLWPIYHDYFFTEAKMRAHKG